MIAARDFATRDFATRDFATRDFATRDFATREFFPFYHRTALATPATPVSANPTRLAATAARIAGPTAPTATGPTTGEAS